MITWLTVWVLTVELINYTGVNGKNSHSYQLTYATQSVCEKQRKRHAGLVYKSRCDFQQVPVVTPKK